MEENTRFVVHKRKFFDGIVDFVSFSHEVRHLVEILNTEIEAPEKVVFRPISHPAGFVRLISKRRLTIAEAYIKLLSLSQNADYMGRHFRFSFIMCGILRICRCRSTRPVFR